MPAGGRDPARRLRQDWIIAAPGGRLARDPRRRLRHAALLASKEDDRTRNGMRAEEPVSRIMTETVVVIDAEQPISEAYACFFQYPIHHLPVVSEGKLAGMLSSSDVMKLEFVVPKNASDRATYLDERFTIRQLMRAPVSSLKPQVGVGAAGEMLIQSGVHAAPVVDESDHVIGIVTTSDIIRALVHGPPRRGSMPLRGPLQPSAEEAGEEPHYHPRPSSEEMTTALSTAELLQRENRDLRFLGKTIRYLDQRRRHLEKVLELADRFLISGQDERVHALLLKAIHAAKRAEERSTGQSRTPFPPR